MHGAFFMLLCLNEYSYGLKEGVSGKLWSCLKEVKPLIVYDGEWGIALEPMQGNGLSF